ncbi:hypothetical protein [Streptomyces sp. 4N124]|uniref:hypothetical protein n=1 Tax=Streptomyces sp. 4N124 TaxID=3457420 RepID=UPI003FD0C507
MGAAVRDLQRQSPVQLRARFSGDTAQLVAMAQAMRDLRDDTSRTGTPLTALTARSAAAAAALQLLDNAAQDASRSLRTLRGRAAATAAAMGDLRDTTARAATALNTFGTRAQTADGRLTTLSGNTRTLRGDLDDLDGSLRRVGGSMGALRPALGGIGGGSGGGASSMMSLTQAAILLGPALIPIAAELTAIAAKTAAAGAGVAAFAIAAAGQVKAMSEASQATTKYSDAVEQYGRGSSQAAAAQLEQQRILGKMPPATREAAAAFSVLKGEYRDWSDALAADTMPVVTKSMGLFQAMLPHLTPLVRSTSAELDNLMNVAAGGMATPGFDRFMDKLAGWSAGAISDATTGMVKFSQAMDSGKVNKDLEEFMDYVRANGPLVGESLGNLAKALMHLVVAASDMGVSVLTAVNALAKLVNAIPTSVLSTVLQLYAGMKLLSVSMGLMSAAASAGAISRLAAYFAVMRAAGVSTTLRATAGSMTGVQKAAAGLGVLGVAALALDHFADKARGAPPDVDRLTTSLRQLGETGQFTGELKDSFGSLDGLVARFKKLQEESKKTQEAQEGVFGFRIPVADDIADWVADRASTIAKGKDSLRALSDEFDSVDKALAKMASGGNAKGAAAGFDIVKEALRGTGASSAEIDKAFNDYQNSLADLKIEQEIAARGMGLFGQQAMTTKAQLDAQKGAADGLRASILALNDVNRSAYDAQIQFEAGVDALTASFKEHGATLNLDTAAGQANGQAMSQAAKGHDEMIAAGLAAGESLESMVGKSEKLRSTMMRLATQAFGGNTKAATEYVNKLLGIPSEVKTLIKAERAEAITGLQAVQAAIKATPGAKSIKVDTLNAAAIRALEAVGFKTKALPDGRTEVFTTNGQSLGSIADVRRALDALDGKTANTYTRNYVLTVRETRAVYNTVGRPTKGEGGVSKYASGGPIVGGSGVRDDVPILAMGGEFMINKEQTAKYRSLLEAINADRLPRFAKGGKLTAQQRAEQEAKKGLASSFGISHFGNMAGYQTDSFEKSLGMPAGVSDLVSNLNKVYGQIKASSHGKTESNLLKKLDSSGKALIANQRKLEGVNKALDSAKGKLDDLKGKFDQLKTSVSSSLVSFGNITKIGKYGTSPETLINQLKSDTGRTTEFTQMLEQLKGRGLNAQSISEIAQAGITGGGMATAQSLLNATPEQIKEINALEAQLKASADKAGTVTADAMYGAGIRAAEGLVKGLSTQQAAIEATMMNIAKAMEAAIKKALGIKSPSKLMEPIGEFSAMGVEVGWTKRLSKGATLLSGNTAGLRKRPALMSGASGGAATAPIAPVVNLTVNVSSTDLLSNAGERKRFAMTLARETNDALLDYQKQRRRY